MNIAITVLVLSAIAASLITAGVYVLTGGAGALIVAGVFVLGAALRLQKVLTPNG